jgi:hypothetical protein
MWVTAETRRVRGRVPDRTAATSTATIASNCRRADVEPGAVYMTMSAPARRAWTVAPGTV